MRAGLSVEQAAGRLRLHPKQLRAIEAEELQALPAPAYVNGFVRNYARELGMDPGPLIEDLNAKLKLRGLVDNPPDLGSAGAVHARVLDDRAWRHLVVAGIVFALICAGLIGLWMAHSGARPGGRAAVPAPERAPGGESAAAAPAATTAAATPAAPSGTAGSADSAIAAPPAVAAPEPDHGGQAAPTAPAKEEVAAAAPASEGRAPIVIASATATPPAAGVAAGATGVAAPASGPRAGLVLRFNDRSWVQVSRTDGQVLLSRNGEAGSMELLNAAPPLLLVVGRADAVQVEYRGQPVNLRPYANSQGVARLTLGDGRATSGGQNSR